ncbi:hypothetical protein OU798_13830 [Prolixibacteraceae bacterium Z1-6]|uniref:CBU-0592-like domain-containing protein n=1 Tax=Draconibacterium aestuarii TaxID=2998507 RepID=A0A9X3F6E1_9BACT|nr:hypothetical protein [Prolixibacteraceae bacterium Z1-6]
MEGYAIIGWIGAITFVVAYFMLSFQMLSADKILYHALNAIGGLCLVINSIYLEDTPNFFVNFIWMGIALYSIYRIIKLTNQKLINNSQDA